MKKVTLVCLIVSFTLTATGCLSYKKTKSPMFASKHVLHFLHTLKRKNVSSESTVFLNGLYFRMAKQPTATVVLSNSKVPVALLVDATRVLLSCGMVNLTTSEDELAFVLAHEASHLLLEHHTSLESTRNVELAADRSAIKIVYDNGYSTLPSRHILTRLYTSNANNTFYPSIPERLYQLEAFNQIGSNKTIQPKKSWGYTVLQNDCRS
jgi:hypothetical protein